MESLVWRKTRFGKIALGKSWAELSGESFDSIEAAKDVRLSVIQQRLDHLLEKRAALDRLDEEAFREGYEAYLDTQAEIIESLAPILDRLADAGCLYLIYDPDAGKAREHRKIGFESRFGYSITRGYAVVGTRLDDVTAVPPPLNAVDEVSRADA